MKTIQIDAKDEAALIAAFSAAGLDGYVDRIKTATSFYVGPFTPAGEPYETASGPSGYADYSSPWGFATTGVIQGFNDLKARNVSHSEICTVGWFRAPDDHLCDSSCYPKYFT